MIMLALDHKVDLVFLVISYFCILYFCFCIVLNLDIWRNTCFGFWKPDGLRGLIVASGSCPFIFI